ncbi:MAG: cupin domain-containing protein [Oscillospiraceae bacterium]|jgi:transcriptional regulator with XRE-family HTH domain|nr:cupin domain-containing protein [Oscillospiraceae bacterium]
MSQIQEIAFRIRDLRETLALTQEQAAQKSGMTAAEYAAYELGESDFSFSHLFNIAETLKVDISDLLTGESPKLRGYIVTRRGEGLAFDRRKQYHYHHLAYNFKDKKAEPFLVTVEKDKPDAAKQAHSHDGQEFDYILTGSMRLNLGGNDIWLREGDSVYYDSNLPHVMYAPEGDCRFLAVVIK